MAPPMPHVIAIDGPGGSGKSTVAGRLAARLGWAHLDSGALYRALVCWALERRAWDAAELAGLVTDGALDCRWGRVVLHEKDLAKAIRSAEVTREVWRVADMPAVRKAINAYLRDLAGRRSSVAEGRDMGTAAFPKAPLKVFLDAHPDERARRRTGTESPADLAERSERDQTRKVGRLLPAPDAVVIDTTGIPAGEVVARILAEAEARGLTRDWRG